MLFSVLIHISSEWYYLKVLHLYGNLGRHQLLSFDGYGASGGTSEG